MTVAVASPPPSAGRSHPTYKEMVVQALTELRETGGSSRRAIAKYIADHFSGLPARHDALLSVHLRRLRSQGFLLMSGYSYLLPTAPNPLRGRGRPRKTALDAERPPGQKRGPGRPRKNADLSTSAPFQGVKRGPGRPRSNAVSVAPSAPLPGVKRGPGRPPKNTTPFAASGVKRGPGRPRRNTIPMSVPHTAMPAGKRGRGRPPKNAQILTAASGVKGMPQSVTLVASATTPVLKRRPGRPSKSAVNNNVTSVRRGRGRPPKVLLPAYSSIPFPAVPSLVAGMRKRGRPPKDKRPPGSPRNDKPSQPEFMQSVALTTRGPGRPRKERSFGGDHLKAGVEAQPQAADQAGDVRNGGEVRHLPSSGTSLTEKRGRGRPRKRPLETETTETGVAALVEKRGPGRPRKKNPSAPLSVETEGVAMSGCKRGRGRPRKENPSAGTPAETGIASSTGNKRGRGRPRKDVPFGTESVEAAVEVSRDLAESKPKKEDTSVSENKTETESILSGARMEARPTDAGGALMSGEKASTAHVEAEGAMFGVDPIISNLGNRDL